MEVEIHISFFWSIFILDWNSSVFLCCHCKRLCNYYNWTVLLDIIFWYFWYHHNYLLLMHASILAHWVLLERKSFEQERKKRHLLWTCLKLSLLVEGLRNSVWESCKYSIYFILLFYLRDKVAEFCFMHQGLSRALFSIFNRCDLSPQNFLLKCDCK